MWWNAITKENDFRTRTNDCMCCTWQIYLFVEDADDQERLLPLGRPMASSSSIYFLLFASSIDEDRYPPIRFFSNFSSWLFTCRTADPQRWFNFRMYSGACDCSPCRTAYCSMRMNFSKEMRALSSTRSNFASRSKISRSLTEIPKPLRTRFGRTATVSLPSWSSSNFLEAEALFAESWLVCHSLESLVNIVQGKNIVFD